MLRSSKKKWRPFQQARAHVRKLGLKSVHGWCLYRVSKRPEDIPCNPNVIYRTKGWKGYGDWLGTGAVATFRRTYRSFRAARRFTRRLDLQSRAWWCRYAKGQMTGKPTLPEDIPANPGQTYRRKGWKGWGDWLGTGTLAPRFRNYRSFESAREFAHRLGLKNQNEWKAYAQCKILKRPLLPADIPAWPDGVYKGKGWKNWGDWLGTGNVAVFLRLYQPFEPARLFVRALGLHSISEWHTYIKGQLPGKPPLPADIPHDPRSYYLRRKIWINWRDWLGTEPVKKYEQRPKKPRGKRFFIRRRVV